MSTELLNMYSYTHRLVQLPTLIRETSSRSGSWLTEKLTTAQDVEDK